MKKITRYSKTWWKQVGDRVARSAAQGLLNGLGIGTICYFKDFKPEVIVVGVIVGAVTSFATCIAVGIPQIDEEA
jgi:hypothetical protein